MTYLQGHPWSFQQNMPRVRDVFRKHTTNKHRRLFSFPQSICAIVVGKKSSSTHRSTSPDNRIEKLHGNLSPRSLMPFASYERREPQAYESPGMAHKYSSILANWAKSINNLLSSRGDRKRDKWQKQQAFFSPKYKTWQHPKCGYEGCLSRREP